MKKEMENVRIQLTKDNINYIKTKGSFAKVINFLVQEMINDKSLESKIQKLINN
jgi:hypothetical protein